MNVILYNPRSNKSGKAILPFSLLAVGAVLENKYEYEIVDGNLEHDSLTRLDALIRESPAKTILAVTVMPGPQLEQAIPLCRELKTRYPELLVVWGGYFPT